jgi:hypothetical protein
MNKPITNTRVTTWLLLLQEFDITIVDRLGKENVVADFLSRLNINDDNSPVDDSFPDEHLFAVASHSPWYAYIANYLVAGKAPPHLSPRERRKIIYNESFPWRSVWIFEVSNLWSWEKDLGYKTNDFGRFLQGLDEEDLGKLL